MSDRRGLRAERTRAALIDAGRRLFGEQPVDAVTIDDLVQAAAVGKGSFYNHFPHREALLGAIAADIRTGLNGAIEQANAGQADPARRIARAICISLRYALDEPEAARVLSRINAGQTPVEAVVNRGLVDDLEAGLVSGRLRVATVEAGVLYVLGIAQAALTAVLGQGDGRTPVSLAQQMCALMLRGFGLDAAEADLIAAQASDDIVRKGLSFHRGASH